MRTKRRPAKPLLLALVALCLLTGSVRAQTQSHDVHGHVQSVADAEQDAVGFRRLHLTCDLDCSPSGKAHQRQALFGSVARAGAPSVLNTDRRRLRGGLPESTSRDRQPPQRRAS